MRILTISNCPALEHLGSGYIIANFARGLRTLGHEVDLLEPDEYEICQWMRPRANSYRQALGMLLALRRALQVKNYDLIEFWGGEAWLATRWLVRRGSRPMVVQHTNGPEPRYNRMLQEAGALNLTHLQSWHAEKLVPIAFRWPDAIVTISKYDMIWLAEHKLPRHGRVVAIDTPLPDCLLQRPIKERESRVIGFCGTWLQKKGIAVIITDMTRILREFPEWRFLVLGTDQHDNVQSCFPADVRQQVEVVPMIKEKELLARQYERMEVFVLPSLIESFGVALAEAMACGCAPVTTRVGFAASLVDGKHALLLERPESPYVYEAVKLLILSPDMRQQLGLSAWERVQSLRWDLAAQTLSNLYQDWLSENHSALRYVTA